MHPSPNLAEAAMEAERLVLESLVAFPEIQMVVVLRLELLLMRSVGLWRQCWWPKWQLPSVPTTVDWPGGG